MTASSASEPSHFDELLKAPPPSPAAPPSGLLSKSDFHALFCGGFQVAHFATGLQSLKIESSDGPAQACSGALYDTILEIPALHFMLQPQGKWLERVVAIGMFVVPMSQNVAAELAARQGPQKQGSKSGAATAKPGLTIPEYDFSGKAA